MTEFTLTALVGAAPTLLRQGLLAMLREQWPHLRLTLTAEAAQVAELALQQHFALLVLDAGLPGLALPELLAKLCRIHPSQRLLVLADARTLARWQAAPAWPGACLLVPNHVLPDRLAAALATWLDAAPVPPRSSSLQTSILGSAFSSRELEVLRLVVADQCNEEIANHLCLSVRTVESHRRTLLQKAGTRTLVGLAARAVREGWVA